MRDALAVGVGGFLGALARWGVNLAAARWGLATHLPLGTFAVNVTGCFAIGWFSAWAAAREGLDPAWRLFFVTGFLGALTTFSTFAYETHRLRGAGLSLHAALNVAASLVAGYAAVALGARLAR